MELGRSVPKVWGTINPLLLAIAEAEALLTAKSMRLPRSSKISHSQGGALRELSLWLRKWSRVNLEVGARSIESQNRYWHTE